MNKGFLIILVLLCISCFLSAQNYSLKSPDGKLVVSISKSEELTWSVSFDGKEIMQKNRLGMVINQNSFPQKKC